MADCITEEGTLLSGSLKKHNQCFGDIDFHCIISFLEQNHSFDYRIFIFVGTSSFVDKEKFMQDLDER